MYMGKQSTKQQTPEEVANYKRIKEIENKMQWGTATFQERNILRIYQKRLGKNGKVNNKAKNK